MGAVYSFGRYRPYWANIVGACYVARTLLYAGFSSVRRPRTCILGRGEDRIYPLGRLPTFSSALTYTPRPYSEAMDMSPSLTYTPCATYSRRKTGNIITFAQFEEGNLPSETNSPSETRNDAEISD